MQAASEASATRLRSAGAAALVLSVASVFGYDAVVRWHAHPLAVGFATLLAGSAFGLTRRSLHAEVASRAVVWMTLAGLMVQVLARVAFGMPLHVLPAAGAMATGGALWLTHPMLHTEEALRAFAPARFRSSFLAGAITVTGAALGSVAFAWAGLVRHSPIQLVFNAALALVLAASVRGVLSMRAWGVVLGGATSAALLVAAPFYGSASAITLSLAAAPALLFWVLPLVIGRKRPSETSAESVGYRIAERVSSDPCASEELSEDAELATAARARLGPAA